MSRRWLPTVPLEYVMFILVQSPPWGFCLYFLDNVEHLGSVRHCHHGDRLIPENWRIVRNPVLQSSYGECALELGGDFHFYRKALLVSWPYRLHYEWNECTCFASTQGWSTKLLQDVAHMDLAKRNSCFQDSALEAKHFVKAGKRSSARDIKSPLVSAWTTKITRPLSLRFGRCRWNIGVKKICLKFGKLD